MSTVEDFQASLEGLAADNEDTLLDVYAAYLLAQLDTATAVGLIAARINQANAVAVTLADTYVVASIEELGEPATAVGLLPIDESERLTQAANTILTEPSPNTTEDQLSRLAHAEPFQTAQKASVEAMSKQPMVEGWVRQFESAKPCKLCVWIWREGRVWPKNHPFQTMHVGDKCVPRVVLSDKPIQSTQKTRSRRNGR